MAIKGKKKSGSRGSQARRRPAAAPRPVVSARRKDPWYQTATGRVVAAVLVVLLLAGIGTTIAVARGNANEEKKRREAVEDYVGELESVVQEIAPQVGAMTQITGSSSPDQLESLKEDAQEWTQTFEGANGRLSGALPPEGVASIGPLYTQALQGYLTSARTMSDAADLEGKARADILTRASEIRGQAEGLWTTATGLLDDELSELGGDPSGLRSPGIAGASAAAPPPTEEAPAEDEAPAEEETGS